MVFGTVHPQSVDALFEAASHINMRMIAGKVMMDRNAPDYLLDTAESSYHQSKELIERWHKKWSSAICDYATLRPDLIS
ncbi:amidohydrolase family protein [Escherichia coli]|nr:amidohydrolase family protein [Escherichia coli]